MVASRTMVCVGGIAFSCSSQAGLDIAIQRRDACTYVTYLGSRSLSAIRAKNPSKRLTFAAMLIHM